MKYTTPPSWRVANRWIVTCTTVMCAGLSTLPCAAQPAVPLRGEPLLPEPQEAKRVEAAVDMALVYLVSQQRANGSWPSRFGDNHGINGICLLAFLGGGHVPGRGPFKHVVDRAVNHLLVTQDPETGLYRSPNQSQGAMYEHGLATLATIEAYGYLPTSRMHRSVQSAVDLIVQSQSPLGGWRYQPVPTHADLSVTATQIIALRAAQNARMRVPNQTMKLALMYVRQCALPTGGFCYQPQRKGGAQPVRTAAGVLSMQLLGAFDDPAVERGLNYMRKVSYNPRIEYFYYMNYYAMQAAFQAGGNHWEKWHPKVRNFLLEHQNDDGSWPGYSSDNYNGQQARCYSTAFAAICLEVYFHFLPAYQR